MRTFIISIIATICLVSMVIYQFLCLCLIIKKEKFVEKIWKHVFPNKHYDENVVFMCIRPMCLQISLMCFLFSGGVLTRLALFNLLMYLTIPLTLGAIFRIIKRK